MQKKHNVTEYCIFSDEGKSNVFIFWKSINEDNFFLIINILVILNFRKNYFYNEYVY